MKIMIVGVGEIGFHIAERLVEEKQDVVVVDANPERLKLLEEKSLDLRLVEGSGSSPAVLREAGVAECELMLAVTDSDEVNLVSCAVGQGWNPHLIKIARLRNPDFMEHEALLVKAGLKLDLIINPELETAKRILRTIHVPMAADIVEFAEGRVLLVGFQLHDDAPIIGTPLKDLRRPDEQRLLVAAIYRQGAVIVPTGQEIIRSGDLVYLVAERGNLDHVIRAVGGAPQPLREVMIFGGSLVGLHLAEQLEREGVRVRLIESDEAQGQRVSERFHDKKNYVLVGHGMDRELLINENIAGMDVFISASREEQDNILAALLAKNLGAKYAVAVTNRADYANLVHNIGVDMVVSPQMTAAGAILRHVRKGKIRSVQTVHEPGAEAIEFVALPTSDMVGRPLKQIAFPPGAVILSVVRGEQVIIPHGDTMIEPDDRVIIFARHEAVEKVEQRFRVRLEFF